MRFIDSLAVGMIVFLNIKWLGGVEEGWVVPCGNAYPATSTSRDILFDHMLSPALPGLTSQHLRCHKQDNGEVRPQALLSTVDGNGPLSEGLGIHYVINAYIVTRCLVCDSVSG
jgi:hypothetical protein